MMLRASMACALVALTVACTAPAGDEVDSTDDSIVGGKEAEPGSWPGTVMTLRNGSKWCGGALISDEWVLTAAHCVVRGGNFTVIIDRHKFSSSEGEAITATKAFAHPGYNSSTFDNDIALIQLSRKTTAKTVKLPHTGDTLSSGVDVTTVGWGATSQGGPSSDVLLEVAVPVISNDTCKGYSGYNKVTPNQICAGLEQGTKDSCQGDSGGPLFTTENGVQVEVGLVSWGRGCAQAKAPGVYTRIANYLDWIKQSTGGAAGE